MMIHPILIAILLAGSLGCLLLALLSLQRRYSPGSLIFALLMLAVAIYSFSYSLELGSTTLEGMLASIRLEYIGISSIPALWLLLALTYTGHTKWVTYPRILLFWIIPLITVAAVYTNPLHHLFYSTTSVDMSGLFPTLKSGRGPLYYLNIFYEVVGFLTGTILLAWQWASPHTVFNHQVKVMFFTSLISIAVIILYISGVQPLPNLDINSFAMILASAILGWGLFRYRLTDLTPVAERIILQKIQMGVIVLDPHNRIVETNPRALLDLDTISEDIIGRDIFTAIPQWPKLIEFLKSKPGAATIDISGPIGKEDHTYFVETTPFTDTWGQSNLVIIRDNTQRIETENRLREQQRSLATLEERERVVRELHDGIGQVLGYVNTQSQAAREYIRQGQVEIVANILEQITQVSQEAHANIRDFILGIKSSSASIDAAARGLLPSLQQYVDTFTARYGIQVNLSTPSTMPVNLIESANEVLFLRIIQETLTNAGKHSHASSIQITLFFDNEWVRAVIFDNGCGFDPDRPPSDEHKHFGIQIMRERAEEMGGHFEIRSAPGQGAQVIIEVPRPHKPKPSSLSALRVVLADDQPLFRDGLRNLLASRGIRVIGEASDGKEAVELTHQLHPDFVLMDVNMPVMNGIEAVRLIKSDLPSTRIVMLTVAEDEETLFQAIRNGASGYLLKGLQADEFFHLLEELSRGETPISPHLSTLMLKEFSQNLQTDSDLPVETSADLALTERQLEILTLSAQRMTYKEIASRLYLSEATVKYHVAQILDRLHVKTRVEAIQKAEKEGLFHPDA